MHARLVPSLSSASTALRAAGPACNTLRWCTLLHLPPASCSISGVGLARFHQLSVFFWVNLHLWQNEHGDYSHSCTTPPVSRLRHLHNSCVTINLFQPTKDGSPQNAEMFANPTCSQLQAMAGSSCMLTAHTNASGRCGVIQKKDLTQTQLSNRCCSNTNILSSSIPRL